jgi:hypothetical protein
MRATEQRQFSQLTRFEMSNTSADNFDVLESSDDPLAAPKEVLDDIASLVVSSDDTVLSGTKEILTKVAVRKPKKDEFFRTHPTACHGPCIIYEVQSQMATETYVVAPAVWNVVKELLKGHARRVVLRATMARGGLLFLNPIVDPDPLAKSNDYHETARESAIAAITSWVRQQADTTQGKYRLWVAEGDLGEPLWPEFDIKDLVRKAFKGRVISSIDHELIEGLRGLV